MVASWETVPSYGGAKEQESGDVPGAGWKDLMIYVGISQP